MKLLILGSDSSVGSRVFTAGQELECHEVWGTSRRASGKSIFHLDLLDESTWKQALDWRPDAVLAFFAISNLKECEVNQAARDINVTSVAKLVDRFGRAGSRVVFLSTNSVFGGERSQCGESDVPSPRLRYSRQKAEAEDMIRNNAKMNNYAAKVSVVRITRVLTGETAPYPSWVAALGEGKRIEAFTDFIFSPISSRYVADALFRIVECNEGGVFHLSGDRDISYCAMAEIIRDAMGGCGEVSPTTSIEKGVELLFRPAYSALGMERTSHILGLEPQPPESVVEDLLPSWRDTAISTPT